MNLENIKNKIIAHRGIHDNKIIPENSLKAFEEAANKEIPIELDIQISKDNELYVIHDDNLSRLTGQNLNIQNITSKEIKDLRLLNTNHTIPTLDQVLNQVNGKVLLDIEIKNTKRYKQLVKLLIEKLENYNGEHIIKSFNPQIVRYLKTLKSNYTVGLLIESNYQNKILNLLCKNAQIIRYAKADFIAIDHKLLEKEKWQRLSKIYPTLIWTITQKEEIKKYKNVSYICNNINEIIN